MQEGDILSALEAAYVEQLEVENADLRQQHAELAAPVGGNCSPEDIARMARISEQRALRMKGNADDRYYDTKALLDALVRQIEMCRPVDEVGHAFFTNRAYIDAQSHLKQIEEAES